MQYGMFLHQLGEQLELAETKLLRAAELFADSSTPIGAEMAQALMGLLDARRSQHAAAMRAALLSAAFVREPSVSGVSAMAEATPQEQQAKTGLLKKVGRKLRKHEDTLHAPPAPEERALEGFLMKRKKGNDQITTKLRWMVLAKGELHYYGSASLAAHHGSVSLAGARVSLQDPTLLLELAEGVSYVFSSDFAQDSPSVLKWHDALQTAITALGKRSPGPPRASPPASSNNDNRMTGSFKSFKKLLGK
jgi:hypothetical protein